MIDRQRVVKEFNSYVLGYDMFDERIQLKKEHTFHVAKNCEEIAKNSGFSKEDIEIAWLFGMLHDIGRFEQIRRMNTFHDTKEFTHAEYGCKILFIEGMIHRFCDDKDIYSLLNIAIGYHSLLHVPDNLSDREKRFCWLLRDADKIDIFAGFVTSDFAMYNSHTLQAVQDSDITDSVMKYIMAHKLIPFEEMKTPADFFMRMYAMYFDLVYPYSYELVDKQKCFDTLLLFQFTREENRKKFEVVKECIKDHKRNVLLS